MPRILLVKTSSMGDVIHNLPIISDIRSRYPSAEIDWLVEESFADIPALHPSVAQVIPVAIRRWRKTLYQPQTWREIRALHARLSHTAYDFVLDTQGLIKSALIARTAQGIRCGLDWASAREPLATLLYDKKFAVDPTLHAVDRYRQLATQALKLPPDLPLHYGIRTPDAALCWLPNTPYAVLLHATSRDEKLWPAKDWAALGAQLEQQGLTAVLPWGDVREFERAQQLCAQIPGGVLAPRLRLIEAATMLGRAKVVIGVDTGLVHLAAALAVPTVALYCASDPAENGLYAHSPIRNLGAPGGPPTLAETLSAVRAITH